MGIGDAVAMVLDRHARQVLERHVAVEHEPLRTQREVRRRRREAGFLAPGLEEARADHPARHLLEAEDEDGVGASAGHRARAERERRAAARAARLDVHDRYAREPERGEHLVPGRHTSVHGAAEGRLKPAAAEAGIAERRAHGLDAERREAEIRKPAERMEADAGDVDGPHAAAARKAYETTRWPASSVNSGSTTSSTGKPGRRRVASVSVRRATTDKPPSSATMPSAYGTGPR